MKYQAYPEYKDSGVEWLGDIPKHWESWKLNHFTPIITCGVASTPEYVDEGVIFLSAQNVKQGKVDLSKGFKYITQEKHNELTKNRAPCMGDILLSRVGTVGEACIVDVDFDFSIFVSLTHLRLEQSICTNRFFVYLCSASYTKALHSSVTLVGGGVGNLNVNDLREYNFPIPPIPEQQQIANFLEHETAKIDTLIEKQQQLIKLLKEKRQAVISYAVTKGLNPNAPMRDSGVEWLGEVPEHWEIKKFSRCASIRNGQVDPRELPYSQYTLIAPNHIESNTGRLLYTETASEQGADSGKYLCKEGEVIYSKIRPALAKVCFSPNNQTICSADMYPVKGIESLTNGFLYLTLLSAWFTSLVILESDRVAMPKINREKLAEVQLPIPPEHEQLAIFSATKEKLSVIDSLLAKADESINLSNERRTALISAAVTGKIDVRNWAAPAHPCARDMSASCMSQAQGVLSDMETIA